MLLTGLIGRPVSHSIGQRVYNRFYSIAGIGSVYLSIDITPENLERFVSFSKSHFIGYNITIPHKVTVMKFLDSLEPEASEIGAVNLVKNTGGNAHGYNTDYLAMKNLGSQASLDFNSSSVAVMGTGGVARTVLYYLSRNHPEAEVTVFSRDPESVSNRLSDYESSNAIRFRKTGDVSDEDHFDILINCSPLGMWPEISKIPFDQEMIDKCTAGIDLVYNPVETSFVRSLRKKGKIAVNGAGFFIDQGYESLKIFFGDNIDGSLFRSTAETALKESMEHG